MLNQFLSAMRKCSTMAATTSSTLWKNVTISQLNAMQFIDSPVKVNGWVERNRKVGHFSFLDISDGLSPSSIQVVVPRELCTSVPVGSAISVCGEWKKSDGKEQDMELLASQCVLLSQDVDPRYLGLSPDNLRKKLHLRSRHPHFAALLRLRSRLTMQSHNFFQSREYIYIDTPILTANDCEGAGETFRVNPDGGNDDFFSSGGMTMTVSGQLHLEAIASGISRVYTMNGGFRAEKQQSSSHLAEFRMLEGEISFCDNLDELCSIVEEYLKFCATKIREDSLSRKEYESLGCFQIKDHGDILTSIIDTLQFPRIPYSEAVRILESNKQKVNENGLNKKNEQYLVEYCKSPVFITHFPVEQKPFYMSRTQDGKFTESFDLLCPIVGELAGGSIREPSANEIKQRGANIDWYIETRTRGKPISAGFGLGIERLIQVLAGVKNIKDTIAFPRWFKHGQC